MIKLAHGTQEELMAQVEGGLTFSDIFDTLPFDKTTGKCTGGDKTYTTVNAGQGIECLRLKVRTHLGQGLRVAAMPRCRQLVPGRVSGGASRWRGQRGREGGNCTGASRLGHLASSCVVRPWPRACSQSGISSLTIQCKLCQSHHHYLALPPLLRPPLAHTPHLQAGMEKAAAFHETRRYAAYMGATTETTKW